MKKEIQIMANDIKAKLERFKNYRESAIPPQPQVKEEKIYDPGDHNYGRDQSITTMENTKEKFEEIIKRLQPGLTPDYEMLLCLMATAYNLDREEWIPVSQRLPEIGDLVEVITEFMNKGNPDSDRFIGYMDEYGDLISSPEDENYGWEFNDCVTHWRELPKPPNQK